MERDIQFEVQYLLSLTLVVFGLLSIDTFRESINPWVGYLVILLLSTHFSIFILSYGMGQGLPYSIDFLDAMERWSRPVLYTISLAFAYFIGHTVHSLATEHFISNFSSVPPPWGIVIEYVGPILYIVVMVVAFRNNVTNTIEDMEDINIKILPHSLRVFSSPEESKRLSVKVENNGEAEFDYELRIRIPPDVALEIDGNRQEEWFETDGTVGPHRADRISFGVFHVAQERATDVISVTVDFEGGSKTREVETDLVL